MPVQKPNVKSSAEPKKTQPDLLTQFKMLGNEWKDQFFSFAKNWEKFRDIIKNNYDLGRYHLKLGNLQDATFRFKLVVWMEPLHADAWYYLGCCYLAEGKDKMARDALRKALKIKPTNEEMQYMMAIALGSKARPESLPKRIPLNLTKEHFDAVAPLFNRDQIELLQYQGHTLIANAVRAQLVPGRVDHVILELGVGTGLCGPLLRDTAAHITGIDISGPMLAEAMLLQDAQGRKIYDALINREMTEFITEAPAAGYDIVIAAGVFSYVGDLQQIFAQVSRILKPGGLFAFTADQMEGEGYRFDPEAARFTFSRPYLRDLAKTSGLNELKLDTVAVYPDANAWLCVYGK